MLYFPADMVFCEETNSRLPREEYAELTAYFNTNLEEGFDDWLDADEETPMMRIIDSAEFLELEV